MTDEFKRARDLFDWNEKVFAFVGAWPLQSTHVKFTFWFVYFLIHMTALFADLFHQIGNLELVILNLMESAFDVMIVLKLLTMRYSQTLANLMKRTVESVDAKFFRNIDEKNVYLRYNRIATRFFNLWLTMGMVSAILYHLKPLENRIKSVMQNESMPFELAYRTRYFFEVTEDSTFWLVWIFQIPAGCMSVFYTATIGYIFTLVLHVCGKLSVLIFRINNLKFDSRHEYESSKSIFRDIFENHREILDMATDINGVFGFLLLEELIISTLLIGLTCYNVMEYLGSGEIGIFFSYLSYGFTMLLLIYGYCAAGEYLITESTNLYNVYYDCLWYNLSNTFKKQLIICMIGASRPIQLNAAGFYVFSRASYMSILKSAAGYISMLRTLN